MKTKRRTTGTYKSQALTRVGENLYRNGEHKYYARIFKNGKQHKKCLDTHDRQTAENSLADFEKQIERQVLETPDLLYQDLVAKWLEWIKPSIKQSTYALREKSLKQLERFFKGKKLREIKREDLQKWATARAIKTGARTFNIERETLGLLFKFAQEELSLIEKNPVTAIKKRKVIRKIIVPPTRQQFTQLLNLLRGSGSATEKLAAKKKTALELVEFLAYSGCRIDEARNVLWKHVDFKKGTLLVTGGEKGTKNHKERLIPLFEPLKQLLWRMSDGKDMPPDATIFNHKSSKTALSTACKAMGLNRDEYFSNHDFRHFFASNAIELNIPDHVIASWLGHSDGGILVKTTYGHLRKGFSDDMAKLMTFKG